MGEKIEKKIMLLACPLCKTMNRSNKNGKMRVHRDADNNECPYNRTPSYPSNQGKRASNTNFRIIVAPPKPVYDSKIEKEARQVVEDAKRKALQESKEQEAKEEREAQERTLRENELEQAKVAAMWLNPETLRQKQEDENLKRKREQEKLERPWTYLSSTYSPTDTTTPALYYLDSKGSFSQLNTKNGDWVNPYEVAVSATCDDADGCKAKETSSSKACKTKATNVDSGWYEQRCKQFERMADEKEAERAHGAPGSFGCILPPKKRRLLE